MTDGVVVNYFSDHYETVETDGTRVITAEYQFDDSLISAQIIDRPADHQGADETYTVTQNYDGSWQYQNATIVTATSTDVQTQSFDANWHFTGAVDDLSTGVVQTRDANWNYTSSVYGPNATVPLDRADGIVVGDTLYAAGGANPVGAELYRLDLDDPNAKPQLVADLNTQVFHGSNPRDFLMAGDTLYFVAQTTITNGVPPDLYSLDTSDPNAHPVEVISALRTNTSSKTADLLQVTWEDKVYMTHAGTPAQLYELDLSGPDTGLHTVDGAAFIKVTQDGGGRSTAEFYDNQYHLVKGEIDTTGITGQPFVSTHETYDADWRLTSWTGYDASGAIVGSIA